MEHLSSQPLYNIIIALIKKLSLSYIAPPYNGAIFCFPLGVKLHRGYIVYCKIFTSDISTSIPGPVYA